MKLINLLPKSLLPKEAVAIEGKTSCQEKTINGSEKSFLNTFLGFIRDNGELKGQKKLSDENLKETDDVDGLFVAMEQVLKGLLFNISKSEGGDLSEKEIKTLLEKFNNFLEKELNLSQLKGNSVIKEFSPENTDGMINKADIFKAEGLGKDELPDKSYSLDKILNKYLEFIKGLNGVTFKEPLKGNSGLNELLFEVNKIKNGNLTAEGYRTFLERLTKVIDAELSSNHLAANAPVENFLAGNGVELISNSDVSKKEEMKTVISNSDVSKVEVLKRDTLPDNTMSETSAPAKEINRFFYKGPLKDELSLKELLFVENKSGSGKLTAEGYKTLLEKVSVLINNGSDMNRFTADDGLNGPLLGNEAVAISKAEAQKVENSENNGLRKETVYGKESAEYGTARTSEEQKPQAAAKKDFDNVLREKIITQISDGTADGVRSSRKEIVIKLEPEFLGPLRLKISSDGTQVKVDFITQSPLVKGILESNAQHLFNSLNQNGLELSKFSVQVGNYNQQERDRYLGKEERDREEVESREIEGIDSVNGNPELLQNVKSERINLFI